MTGAPTENAAQIYLRILGSNRPSLVNLSPEIIPKEGPRAQDLIEIVGDVNVGKTIQLMELLALTILPIEFGGKGASAIVIDTNSNFHVPNLLAKVLEKHILHKRMSALTAYETEDIRIESSDTEEIVFEALKRFTIIKCYSENDFENAIIKAKELLWENGKISLIAIDSIETFYWNHTSDQPIRAGTYLKRKLIDLKKVCEEYHIVIVYTRSAYFVGMNQFDEIRYQIELIEKSTNLFEANILSKNESNNGSRCYEINDFGIEWLSSSIK